MQSNPRPSQRLLTLSNLLPISPLRAARFKNLDFKHLLNFCLLPKCRTLRTFPALQDDKPSKRFWRDRHAGDDEAAAQLENGASTSGTAAEPISLDDLAERRVDEVGTVNPAQDFDTMIARTDDPNLIPKVSAKVGRVMGMLVLLGLCLSWQTVLHGSVLS